MSCHPPQRDPPNSCQSLATSQAYIAPVSSSHSSITIGLTITRPASLSKLSYITGLYRTCFFLALFFLLGWYKFVKPDWYWQYNEFHGKLRRWYRRYLFHQIPTGNITNFTVLDSPNSYWQCNESHGKLRRWYRRYLFNQIPTGSITNCTVQYSGTTGEIIVSQNCYWQL